MRVDFCLKHKFQISLHAVALRQAVIRVSLLFGQFPSPCILEVVVVEIPVLLESHTFHLYSETTHGQTHSDLQLRQLSLQATSQGSGGAVGGWRGLGPEDWMSSSASFDAGLDYHHLQGWKVTEYIYSVVLRKYNFEVLE